MASTTAASNGAQVQFMPDHTRSSKLEDQAATAALYITHPERKSDGDRFLDSDNKLSSAGMSTCSTAHVTDLANQRT